jgi:transposase
MVFKLGPEEGPSLKTSDAQVRKLMKEMQKHGKVGLAADRSGMDRKTARKYVRAGKLPSELEQPRWWRTRKDPIASEDWALVEALLADSPELQAKTLFEMLQERRPEAPYPEGLLRTLQRRVKDWRATKGPDKEVFFSQAHKPGEAAQTDFTHATELGVTVRGQLLVHMLCHFVLPYSNWQSVTVCMSESLLALRRGVQTALFRLGHHPQWHQTDNSTAATHTVGASKRKFNEEYESMIVHFGMKPRTTEVGAKEQNGDVEASNGALKRRIAQRLLVRGSADFDSIEAYETWLATDPVERANAARRERLAHELAVMPAVHTSRLPEFKEQDMTVTGWSTIRVDHNAYSVPSRLIAERVRVRIFERHLEVYYAQKLQLSIERVVGRNGHRINYRHIIWSLVRKPGAFARYRYREDLFPSLTFRRAYDAIAGETPTTTKDLEYLRILHLAAATSEADVEAALTMLLDARKTPNAEVVKDLLGAKTNLETAPPMAALEVDLGTYDDLLTDGAIS